MLRKLIAKFYRTTAERRAAPRYGFQAPVKIWIEAVGKTGRLKTPVEPIYIYGQTKDLSASGIAFLVPSIRIRESYLVGENNIVNAEVDLPNGTVRMRISGRRYEQIGEHLSVSRYLIGAGVLEISEESREIYEQFLRSKGKIKEKIVRLEKEKTKEPRKILETV